MFAEEHAITTSQCIESTKSYIPRLLKKDYFFVRDIQFSQKHNNSILNRLEIMSFGNCTTFLYFLGYKVIKFIYSDN